MWLGILFQRLNSCAQVWVQQYYIEARQLHFIGRLSGAAATTPIASPYDVEARNRKSETRFGWAAAFIAETCDDELPNLITNVETTPATVVDDGSAARCHSLKRRTN